MDSFRKTSPHSFETTTVATTSTSRENNNVNKNTTYAQVAQESSYPKKEQAIDIDAIDGFTLAEYTVAVSKKVNPSDIRFVSKISQGRVCLFLSKKSLVDDLTKDGNNVISVG
ncbi:hypothetical protein HHI36_024185 [Cryptolaemus montrouzieri]|uniref:Uncharacterized protein n=1 Tax=Cryptolaemus montrouzieri TaxID=559131 RepID=A0ABD2N7T0_9CUCU